MHVKIEKSGKHIYFFRWNCRTTQTATKRSKSKATLSPSRNSQFIYTSLEVIFIVPQHLCHITTFIVRKNRDNELFLSVSFACQKVCLIKKCQKGYRCQRKTGALLYCSNIYKNQPELVGCCIEIKDKNSKRRVIHLRIE